MPLSRNLQRSFEPGSRARGEGLHANHSVDFSRKLDGSGVEFIVHGGNDYRVQIFANQSSYTLSVSCTCPHFDSGFACKHVWASLLECDGKNYIGNLQKFGSLILTSSTDDQEPDGEVFPDIMEKLRQLKQEKQQRANSWLARLKQVQEFGDLRHEAEAPRENERTASFLLDVRASVREQEIQLRFLAQEHLKSGKLGIFKLIDMNHASLALFPDPTDQAILQNLLGRTRLESNYSYSQSRSWPQVSIPPEHAGALLLQISQAGKLFLAKTNSYYHGRSLTGTPRAYAFSDAKWKTVVQLISNGNAFEVSVVLTNGSDVRPAKQILGTVERYVFFSDFMAASDLDRTKPWVEHFGREDLRIPAAEIDPFLEMYLSQAQAPELILPSELHFREVEDCIPRVRLELTSDEASGWIGCKLIFVYQTKNIEALSQASHVFHVGDKTRIRRNEQVEAEAQLRFAGLQPLPPHTGRSKNHVHGYFARGAFMAAAEKALSWDWEVVADQRSLRSPGKFEIQVSSGVDWFEVRAEADFRGQKITLPQLISAIRSGSRFVKLDDGTMGILPEEWLARMQKLSIVGSMMDGAIKLTKVQALWLSAELEENEAFTSHRKVGSLKQILEDLRALKPIAAGKNFKGRLRGYQKQGLAWLTLIGTHGIGGILADDMGLGKTVQILALLAGPKSETPHLIVAPKSLIFNWIQEAKRFTPHLRVLNFTGSKRSGTFADYDLILTTYQTLRSDVDKLSQYSFASLILDEAHNVKNPKSQSAMACRLIKASHKIALTGTPVENSLSDLFSILNIVNPGLMSENQVKSWSQERSPEALGQLAIALKPFLLRRTKEAVLKDLPTKTEQVLYCELSGPERKRYDELRNYYWAQLNGKVERKGLARSKIEILEALLRLRQASCHHGLLDPRLRNKTSAKFDLLLDQIESVIQDGHKALIFSQFTSLLALLKTQLDERNLLYEYLDGQTEDRQSRVEKFQNDPSIKLFLLSLKAGGVGLNLTAADYVFILDPWWNPASESQAIDRAHRIGQTKKVFAYKIIAKDTVEEKILQLQNTKKALAQAIVSGEEGLLKNLSMADLQVLFS